MRQFCIAVFALLVLVAPSPAQAWGGGWLFRTLNSGVYKASQTTWSFARDGDIAEVLLPSGQGVSPAAFAYGTQDREAWKMIQRRRVVSTAGTGLLAIGAAGVAGGAVLGAGTILFCTVEGVAWFFGWVFTEGQGPWRTVSWGNEWPLQALIVSASMIYIGVLVGLVGAVVKLIGTAVSARTRRLEEWFTPEQLEAGVETHNRMLRRSARLRLPEMHLEVGPGAVRLAASF